MLFTMPDRGPWARREAVLVVDNGEPYLHIPVSVNEAAWSLRFTNEHDVTEVACSHTTGDFCFRMWTPELREQARGAGAAQ
jgi:hypothetical protein